MNKHCNGCLTNSEYVHSGPHCGMMSFNDKGECPCVNCIIKMMCETLCQDFFHFKTKMEEKDAYEKD